MVGSHHLHRLGVSVAVDLDLGMSPAIPVLADSAAAVAGPAADEAAAGAVASTDTDGHTAAEDSAAGY